MRFHHLVCGALQVNTYLIGADDTNEVVVIDPGVAQPVIEALQAEGLSCVRILLTHGHFDHIGGVRALKEYCGAPVCIHTSDAEMLKSNRLSLAVLTGELLQPTNADVLLNDWDAFSAAGLDFHVLHTPGHTRGGVCYQLEREHTLFSGDTLFCESAGRTDFPGGSQQELYHSIVDRLYTLEGDYTVYCGHERQTTLDHERRCNMFTRYGDRLSW